MIESVSIKSKHEHVPKGLLRLRAEGWRGGGVADEL